MKYKDYIEDYENIKELQYAYKSWYFTKKQYKKINIFKKILTGIFLLSAFFLINFNLLKVNAGKEK